MVRPASLTALAVAGALAAPAPLSAQVIEVTPAQALAHLDAVLQSVSDAAVCQYFGYAADREKVRALAGRAMILTTFAGVDPAEAEKAAEQASDRTIERAAAHQKNLLSSDSAEAAKAKVTQWADRQAETCARLAASSLMIGVMTAPRAEAIQAGKTAAADNYLQWIGQASWQTPVIIARGEYVFALGTCEKRLGASSARKLAAPYTGAAAKDDTRGTREERYYAGLYTLGTEQIAEAAMTAADCKALTSPA